MFYYYLLFRRLLWENCRPGCGLDSASGTSGVNKYTREEIGKCRAYQGTRQGEGIDHVENKNVLTLGVGGACLTVEVGGEERQSRKSRGTNGETLTNCGGGVTDGVQVVGDLPNLRIEGGHLGDTTGVVGDGSVGVHRYGCRDKGKHTEGRHGDTVKTRKSLGTDNGDSENNQREEYGLHTNRHTGGDIKCIALLRSL